MGDFFLFPLKRMFHRCISNIFIEARYRKRKNLKTEKGRIEDQRKHRINKRQGPMNWPPEEGIYWRVRSVQGRRNGGGTLHPGTHPGGGSVERHGKLRVTFR